MNRVLKKAALQTLRTTGLFSASTQFRRKDTLVILCYHGISIRDEHEWEPGLYITVAEFRKRLEWLRDWRANVLPLEEALARLSAGTLPERSVVITFDDGFYDFYRFAWPLLTEFGYPCTLYLTTYYCSYRLPIFNLVTSYLLWKGGATGVRSVELKRLMDEAATAGLTTFEKDEAARKLASSYGINYDALLADRLFQIVTPEEASRMAHGGIDLQLHTHRHRVPHDRGLFLREIQDNSTAIRDLSGRVPLHFCYPSGVTSSEFLPWLREAGVQSATTCEAGLARRDSEALMLPRYLDGSAVERLDFEAWLSGLR